MKKENIDVFVRRGVYTKSEAIARANIQLDTYVKNIRIEARVMLDMFRKDIFPAANAYEKKLCSSLAAKKSLFSLDCTKEENLIKTLAQTEEAMLTACESLENALYALPEERLAAAKACAHVVRPAMNDLRRVSDEAETLCSKEDWKLPRYVDLLYSV